MPICCSLTVLLRYVAVPPALPCPAAEDGLVTFGRELLQPKQPATPEKSLKKTKKAAASPPPGGRHLLDGESWGTPAASEVSNLQSLLGHSVELYDGRIPFAITYTNLRDGDQKCHVGSQCQLAALCWLLVTWCTRP